MGTSRFPSDGHSPARPGLAWVGCLLAAALTLGGRPALGAAAGRPTAYRVAFDEAFDVVGPKVPSKSFKYNGAAGTIAFTVSGAPKVPVRIPVIVDAPDGAGGSWITVTLPEPGVYPCTPGAKGTAKGKLKYRVLPYAKSVPLERTGTISIGEVTFTVRQGGAPCTLKISSSKSSIPPDGADPVSFGVTAPEGCEWKVTPTAPWVSIENGVTGAGSRTVLFSVDANETVKARTAKIAVETTLVPAKVSRKTHSVTQKKGDGTLPQKKAVTVSGTVRNVSGETARRARRGELPTVAGAQVEVRADLNADGLYSRDELFSSTADDNGFFVVSVPNVDRVSKVKVRVTKAGFSDFIREYEGVEGSLVIAPSVSEGQVAEIDLTGVAAGPSRAGRTALDTDEVVTLSLVKDRTTGRRVSRVARGAASGADGAGELLRVAFPLRGLDVPAGSTKVYANVAYLDTVNDSDVMPGGFRAEGEGQTPVDVLSTYGASQIQLFDAAGKELMTDPNDRSKTIQIKMVVPPEAYDTIYDEDTATEQIEIPLYYYDDAAATWKLHKNADQTTAYGWLEDNFGNRLSRRDLATLQQGLYAPSGVDPAKVTIYGVGTVHHFTTWNCDRAGRSSSMNFILKDKNGKDITADVRYRKGRGGNTSDTTRPRGGKGNLHTDYDRNADSLIKKLLDRSVTGEERARILSTIQSGQNVYAKQAIIEALRRYAENLRDDIASGDNDLERGIRAIFNNKTINDAFINTDGLDCTKVPDLCNGILGVAAETVNQSKDAQKAVAFLMQIAVDSYNPSNLNYNYAVDKGVEFLDSVMGMDGVAGELKGLPEKVANAKELAKTAKELGAAYRSGKASFKDYWEAANAFKGVMEDIKGTATALGGRMGRAAPRAAAATPTPATPEEEAELLRVLEGETLREYGDIGGLLLGASRYTDTIFGYYQEEAQVAEVCFFLPLPTGMTFDVRPEDVATFNQYCVTDPSTIAEMIDAAQRGGREALRTAARRVGAREVARDVVRTDLRTPGGGEVGELEYFNGTDWIPLDGRSDLGVDAAFVPVPRNLSFGGGTPGQPMMFLGTWTLDVEANVAVSGRVVTTGGAPARRARVFVGGQEFTPDAEGRISGKLTAFTTSLEVQIPGAYGGWVTVSNGVADVGTLTLPDAVVWAPDLPGTYTTERNATLAVDSSAYALSGDPVTYTFRLRQNYWDPSVAPLDETSGSASTYTFDSNPPVGAGYYYLEVTASTATLSATRWVTIVVVNRPPVIAKIVVTPASPKVGDDIRLSLDATDPDDLDPSHPSEIQYRSLWVSCVDPSGRMDYPWVVQEVTPEGATEWVMKTQSNRDLYSLGTGAWTCSVSASVYDRSWSQASRQETFTLAATAVDPEVAWTSLSPEYTVAYYAPGYVFQLYPAYLASFDDKNGDLDHYEVDCGNATTRTSPEPISEPCAYEGSGDFTIHYKAFDKRGGSAEVTTLVHYLYPLRMTVAPPAGFTAVQQGEGLETVYELPAGALSGQTLAVSAVSDNGPSGYGEGAGTLEELNYSLTYQSGESWWPQYVASYQAVAGGTVPVTVDKPGTYSVTLWARDAKGIYANFAQTFKVTAPFDGAVTVNGQTQQEFAASGHAWFMAGEPVTFDVAATGPAGWTPSYAWTVDGAAQPASTQKTFTPAFTEGEHTVRLALRNPADTVNREVVREVTFPVYAPLTTTFASDYAPVVDGEVRPGDAYRVSLAFPAGEEITAARWTVLKDGVVSDTQRVLDTASLGARSFVFTDAGAYQIRVDLEDARGVKTTVTWDEAVTVALHAPEISALTATPASGRPPLAVDVAATASDPDARAGETLRYAWSVDGQVVAGAAGASLRQTLETLGTHAVTVRVTDASGLTAERTVSVLLENKPPVIASLTASPAAGKPPLAVTFTATASDPDVRSGEVLVYRWTVDGTAVSGAASSTLARTFDAEETHTVTVRVTDASGLWAEKSVQVAVRDEAPAISEIKVEKTSDSAPATVTFTAAASDSDGTIASYAWSLKVGETFQAQAGSTKAFSKTFQDPGTYTVKVKVTDDGGKTAEKTASVVLYDPAQAGATFEFKERRADGFGPAYDFTQTDGPYQQESAQKFAKTTVDDVNVTAGNTVDLTPTLGPFPVPGFYGTHREAWGQPTDLLALVKAPGTYTIGLLNYHAGTFPATETLSVPTSAPFTVTLAKKNAMLGAVRDTTAGVDLVSTYTPPPAVGQYAVDPQGALLLNAAQAGHTLAVSYRYRPVVRFPGSYGCGYLAYQPAYADSFGLSGGPPAARSEYSPYLDSQALTTEGRFNVLAILGTPEDVGGGVWRCAPSYYGFAGGTGDILTLPTVSLPTKPLTGLGADALLYDLVGVSVVRDGLTVRLDKSALDTSPQGDLLIPYVTGADYRFEFTRQVGNTVWHYATAVPASAATGAEFLLDVSGIVLAEDVTVQNADPSSSLRMGWKAGAGELWTATPIQINGGTGPLGQTLKLVAATDVELRYQGSDATGSGRSFLSRQTAAAFDPALDLASPAVTSTLTGLQLSVDEVAQTITVQFQTNGELCGVSLQATYNDPSLPQYGYRNRSFQFLADGTKTSYTVSYPIPETPNPLDPNPIPATSALSGVAAEIHCGKTESGYATSLAGILANFPEMGPLNEDLILGAGKVTEAVGQTLIWTKP